ncbi:MAG: KH domain-containing protein, partial [Corynebacterium casei]
MAIITKKFDVDSAYTSSVLGPADDNLRVLNNLLDADLFARGNTVTVTGPDFEVARAKKALEELEAIARRGHAVT